MAQVVVGGSDGRSGRAGAQALAAHVHEVVVQVRRAVADDLERLVGARGGDDGVRRRDCRDDVLDHALRVHQRDAGDFELLRARGGALEDPVPVSYTHLRAHETLMNL
eukprot:4393353-Prymnesium_polylepis.2